MQAHALSAGGRRTHISHAHQTGPCLASGDCCSVNSNATRAMSMSLAITKAHRHPRTILLHVLEHLCNVFAGLEQPWAGRVAVKKLSTVDRCNLGRCVREVAHGFSHFALFPSRPGKVPRGSARGKPRCHIRTGLKSACSTQQRHKCISVAVATRRRRMCGRASISLQRSLFLPCVLNLPQFWGSRWSSAACAEQGRQRPARSRHPGV